jgi:tetratricopeptide (TPR) repeat protein
VIHLRYHYDNSAANVRNRSHPPRRVRAGNQATDEMGHLWLQVLPRGPGDHRRELQEAVIRHHLEKNPNDVDALINVGAIELSRLNAQAAVTQLRAAVKLQQNRPEELNMLGLALAAMGRNAEAIAQYALALRARPQYAAARFNLATALAKAGKLEDAAHELRIILAASPEDPAAKRRLAEVLTLHGQLLLRDGKREDAVAEWDEALKLDPSNEQARKSREQAAGH